MIGTPNTGHPVLGVPIKTEKQKLPHPPRVPTVPFHLILPPQKVVFARRICGQAFPGMAACFAEKSYSAQKKHRKTASAIYSAVSYRFYNVFCKKGFTNEFQKHII